ncbi:hypothetical protein VIGAN_05166600 [Vigna angularis var. angularis]|uniref:Uncharacterized protein n=1 Tax=Vigna angularis var. angularis TaxID=157739 RepID=A0A0S3S5X5_PHAAN|nr:hypothetical protein VIGAN_05166600 [Vigna angularis var. angularis]
MHGGEEKNCRKTRDRPLRRWKQSRPKINKCHITNLKGFIRCHQSNVASTRQHINRPSCSFFLLPSSNLQIKGPKSTVTYKVKYNILKMKVFWEKLSMLDRQTQTSSAYV